MAGSISIPRDITERSWANTPSTMYLFIRLLLKANWQEGVWYGVPVGRGELITSVANLSKELNLKDSQTRYSLKCLQDDKRIVCQTTNRFTKITICEYESYQFSRKTDSQTVSQTSSQTISQTDSQTNCNNRIKEINREIEKENKKENKIADFSQDVEELYAIYPTKCPKSGRGTDKGRESKKILVRLLKNHSRQEIESAIRLYLDDCNKTNTFIKNFDSLLHRIERGDISGDLFQPQEQADNSWLVEGKRYRKEEFEGHDNELYSLNIELIRHVKRGGALTWRDGKFIIAK